MDHPVASLCDPSFSSKSLPNRKLPSQKHQRGRRIERLRGLLRQPDGLGRWQPPGRGRLRGAAPRAAGRRLQVRPRVVEAVADLRGVRRTQVSETAQSPLFQSHLNRKEVMT